MVRLKSLCYLNAKLQNFLQFSKDFLQKMFIFFSLFCSFPLKYLLKFRMLSRYRKIEVDSRFSAAEDRGRYSVCGDKFVKLMSFISFYLLLSPFNYKASGVCES